VTSDEGHISPSQQIMMLLEENGISGPPVSKSEAVDASPFDFSGAMSSGGTMAPPPPSSDKKRSRGGKAGSKASKAKAKTHEGATALKANVSSETAPPPPPFILESSSRRESEGEEKRLSAGSILALFDQVDGQAAAAVTAARDSIGGKVQTPAPPLEHIDTSLCEAGEASKQSGDGTSPSLNQLSPINPMHLNDLLTAF